MGGASTGRLDETGTTEELGSVGDWRLPDWMPRISGIAWLFMALAMLSVIGQLAPFAPGLDFVASIESGRLLTAITRALPILVPAATLWRTGRPRPRPLLVGSVAVGIGAFMASGFPDPSSSLEPVFGGGGEWQAYLDLTALWISTLALTFAGPVLLANVLRAEHRGASARRTIGAGVAVGGLAIGYIAMTALFPVYLYHLHVTDPSYQGGGLMLFGIPNLQSVVVAALVGWAYFAWVTLAAETDGTRRAAWLMGRAAVIIQQGLVAVGLVAMVFWYLVARSGQDTPLADAAVWISGAVFLVTPVLLSVASVLLIAALAAGLGYPGTVELDPRSIRLEPLPNPG